MVPVPPAQTAEFTKTFTSALQTQGTGGFSHGGVLTMQGDNCTPELQMPMKRQPLREHIPAEQSEENQSYTQNETDICRDSLITANAN